MSPLTIDPCVLRAKVRVSELDEHIPDLWPSDLRELEVSWWVTFAKYFGETETVPVVGDGVDNEHLKQMGDDTLAARFSDCRDALSMSIDVPNE
ncbi:hypothetical protein [Halalkalicoccus salilacus]|uniref:hypothetical protein n=1 Tax=Halalkalicoccus salilacus TaxID=3117459 RepID=UPI00300E9C52